MATLAFRQGLVRYQTDISNAPNFLQKVSGGQYININVSPTPTTFTIAHFDQNYLFIEQKSVNHAWGPFNDSNTCWLYWDVDFITGELTRNHTYVDPISQASPPPTPAIDKHWFDTANKIMKVWSGTSWVEKLRVFAATYQNSSTIIYYPLGSQVGISSGSHVAGFPLYDDSGNPVQKFNRNRRGQFIHTESSLASQFAKTANFRIEGNILQAEALEFIPKYSVAAYKQDNKIGLCTNVDADFPAVGIVVEDINVGDVRTVLTNGPLTNEDWNWTVPTMTPLFVDSLGNLTTTPPSVISIQHIGYVVGVKTIVINIQPQIRLTAPPGNYAPTFIELGSGKMAAGAGLGSGSATATGFTHIQSVSSSVWTVVHASNTENVNAQFYDSLGNVIIPHRVTIIDDQTIEADFNGAAITGKAQLVLVY